MIKKSLTTIKNNFTVKGLREERANNLAIIISTIIIWTLLIDILIIIIIHDNDFSLIYGSLVISVYSFLVFRFNFEKLAIFIVDYEYSLNNFYEIERVERNKTNGEYKVLKNLDISKDINLDSPELKVVRDIEQDTLESIWLREPLDKVPAWDGLTILCKYTLKMVADRMD